MQFYSTWKTTFHLPSKSSILQYPHLTVVILRQYHKNFCFNITTEYHLQKEQSRWRRKEKSATNDSKVNQTNERELSDKWSPINASSHIKPKGNADSKQRLINSQKFFKLHRKSEQRRIINNKTSFRQQNKGFIATGAETSHRVKIGEYFYHNFTPKLCVAHRLSSMQECVLVPHITCMFENMSKWRNHTFLFQKSPQVFQGEAHTLCKIDESNNNVGRATVFDTKKRCDE